MRLPTITLGDNKTYFVDLRLKQLRNVDNPHDYLEFENRGVLIYFCEENHAEGFDITSLLNQLH
jgi:hypothetical protein